jgi:diguanylate cyclase (GGDEF)-like protein
MLKVLLVILLTYSFSAAGKDATSVLLLNSYHPQYSWTSELTRGVQDVLLDRIYPENLYIEFMDARRFVDDNEYNQLLIALLKHKYKQYEPDVIITSDDHAYYFMIEHGEALFPNKPIVFSGVNVFPPETLIGKNNITGIKEGMEIEGNLSLILALQPNTKRIIMLGDTTGLGLRMVESAHKIKAQWSVQNDKKSIELEVWDDFSLDELYLRSASVDKDSVFLMLAVHKDNTGEYFSFENELPILAKHSQVPIYGMWGALMIGNGVIGGLMNNPYEHGRNAAKIALDVIAGTSINSIKIKEKALYQPIFDYQQLQKHSININNLPENSVVVGQPVSLYLQYKVLINSVIALLIFLAIVISVLINNIRKRVVAQNKLIQFNVKLESMIEVRTQDLAQRNKELEAVSQRMEELAHTDALTGLSNRRAGTIEVNAYLQRSNIEFESFSVAILDLDHFKQINDTYGHLVGDEVLIIAGTTLKSMLRRNDRVYRWGGEEFLILLPTTPMDAAIGVCQRFNHCIGQLEIEDVRKITISIGVATFNSGDTFDTLLQRADDALYAAKKNGRNQVLSTKEM